MIYVLFAVFMGFVGSVIFKDGLFANVVILTATSKQIIKMPNVTIFFIISSLLVFMFLLSNRQQKM